MSRDHGRCLWTREAAAGESNTSAAVAAYCVSFHTQAYQHLIYFPVSWYEQFLPSLTLVSFLMILLQACLLYKFAMSNGSKVGILTEWVVIILVNSSAEPDVYRTTSGCSQLTKL